MTRTTPHLSYFKFCLKNENKAPENPAIRTLTNDVKESGCVYVVILKQTFCCYTCVQAQVLGEGWSATAQLGSGTRSCPPNRSAEELLALAADRRVGWPQRSWRLEGRLTHTCWRVLIEFKFHLGVHHPCTECVRLTPDPDLPHFPTQIQLLSEWLQPVPPETTSLTTTLCAFLSGGCSRLILWGKSCSGGNQKLTVLWGPATELYVSCSSWISYFAPLPENASRAPRLCCLSLISVCDSYSSMQEQDMSQLCWQQSWVGFSAKDSFTWRLKFSFNIE